MIRSVSLGLVLLGILSVASTIVITGLGSSQQSPSTNAKKQTGIDRRPKLGDPTPVEEGVITEKQRKHSKLYKVDGPNRRKLRDLVSGRTEVDVVEEAGDVQIPRVLYLDKYLRKISCQSDAVVIGTVSNKSSQLIEQGTFAFTDYEVAVSQVLKDNSLSTIQPSSVIVTTRSGGSVRLNGRVVRALDYREEPLEVNEQYLLFLKYLPETGAYRPAGSALYEDSFQIEGDRITQLSERSLPFTKRRSSSSFESFVNTLYAVLTGSCN